MLKTTFKQFVRSRVKVGPGKENRRGFSRGAELGMVMLAVGGSWSGGRQSGGTAADSSVRCVTVNAVLILLPC